MTKQIISKEQKNAVRDFEIFVIKYVAEHPNVPNPKLSKDLLKELGSENLIMLKQAELVTNFVSKVIAKELKKNRQADIDENFYNNVHTSFLAVEKNGNAIKKLFRMFLSLFFETNETRGKQFEHLINGLEITGGYKLDKPKELKKPKKVKAAPPVTLKDVLTAIVRGELVDGKDPIVYAIEHKIKILGMDPIVYAHNTQTAVEGNPSALSWVLIHNLKNEYDQIAIEGIDPAYWILQHPNEKIHPESDNMKHLIEEGFTILGQNAVAYAMQNRIPINGNAPHIWLIENGYKLDEQTPLHHAVKHNIKFNNENPLVWAMKNADILFLRDHIKDVIKKDYKIDNKHPLVYAAENGIKIAGDSPLEYAKKWNIALSDHVTELIIGAEKGTQNER